VPSQPDIAYDLGIILPPKDRSLMPKSRKSAKPKAGWGTRIDIKQYSINEFFKRRGYELREKYYSAKRFKSEEQLADFLRENLKKQNDLLICFNYPLLYKQKGSWGHASLVEAVQKRYVALRDPSPKYKKALKVLLEDLIMAMYNHYKGGAWVISNK